MRAMLSSIMLLLAQAAQAGEPLPALAARALDFTLGGCTAPDGWARVDAAALDQERGGYDLPSGLTMSIGIERMVSINGQLVTQSSFSIANLASISGEEARLANAALGGQLVQNGSGNLASINSGIAGTFVQNSLNNQTIGAQTIINANVNSAALLKTLNFNSGLRDAGLRSIPTH